MPTGPASPRRCSASRSSSSRRSPGARCARGCRSCWGSPRTPRSLSRTRSRSSRTRADSRAGSSSPKSVMRTGGRAKSWNLPLYRIDEKQDTLQVRHSLDDKEWDEIIAVMAEQGISSLDADGQMTDAVLERVAQVGHITGSTSAARSGSPMTGSRIWRACRSLQELDLSELPGRPDHRSRARGPAPSARAQAIPDVLAAAGSRTPASRI